MPFKQVRAKTFLFLVSIICLFNLDLSNCFATELQENYAAIWIAQDGASRQTAAVKCFDNISALNTTVENVTKHALKHLLVPVELNLGVLGRSFMCWLSYEGKDALMKTIRQILSDLYNTGNDIKVIKAWVSSDEVTYVKIIQQIKKLVFFSNILKCIREQIACENEILHTYSIDDIEEVRDHKEEDMKAIDEFTKYLSIGLTDLDVDNFLGTVQNARDKVLPGLIDKQAILFKHMTLMTKKVLKECFEPCMRAALHNAFHLGGVRPEALDTLPLVDEKDLITNPEYIFIGQQATTTLYRKFETAQEFTQFIRALILVTNEGRSQAFSLAPKVIRTLSVKNPDPWPEVKGGKIKAPIKASVSVINESDGSNQIYTKEGVIYRVIDDPFLASFYFG